MPTASTRHGFCWSFFFASAFQRSPSTAIYGPNEPLQHPDINNPNMGKGLTQMLLCKSAIVCHVGYPNLLPLLMHADYSSSWHLYLRCQTATVSRGFNEIFFDTSIPVSTVALSSPRYSEIRFCILPSWPRPFHFLCFFFPHGFPGFPFPRHRRFGANCTHNELDWTRLWSSFPWVGEGRRGAKNHSHPVSG